MSVKELIDTKLNRLERSLLNQEHLKNPAEFLGQLASLSKYFHLMSEDDRDYLHCAKEAFEEQVEWRIDD